MTMRGRARAFGGRSPRQLRRLAATALAFVLASLPDPRPALADPCLDGVTAYTAGQNGGYNAGSGGTDDLLPDIVLGAPYGLGTSAGSLDVVSLGNGGSITVAFTDNRIVDGPGADFTVFENAFNSPGLGIFEEVAVVAASADGVNFIEFPHGTGPDLSGLAGRLAAVGLASARFLRITDPGAAIDDIGNHFPTPGPGKSGFDLDAVVAIHSENTCAACCDADGDGQVKANDVLLLLRAVSQLPTAVNLCGTAPCDGRSCADADDDRALSAADVLLCLRLASSLPTPYALCSTGDCDLP
jgi:hypothetical protein